MLRTSGKASGVAGRGVAAGAAVTIASVLLLSACGSDDATASSTPTLKTSTTSAAATPTSVSAADSTTEAAPTTTATSEQPQAAQVTPTPVAPKITPKDQAYLDALKARGIAVQSPDIPLQIGTYICQSKASNTPPAEVLTYVSAMAGQDPSYNQNKIPITQLGQSYIDAANQTLCTK